MAKPVTYSFHTFDNPADHNTPTFNNLLGINNEGLIAGFYGSGAAGDPNQGYLLRPPSKFIAVDFPPSPQNPAVQTQLTGLNDKGITVGYFYPTNNGITVDNHDVGQLASLKRAEFGAVHGGRCGVLRDDLDDILR